MSNNYNTARQRRSNARIERVKLFLRRRPMTRREIVSAMMEMWGVSERTVAVTLQYMRRKSIVTLDGGKYGLVE